MRRSAWLLVLVVPSFVACGARSELRDVDGSDEETDSSVPDVTFDVSPPDVVPPIDVIVVDVTPPPPPPVDASDDPPEDVAPDVPDDVEPPPSCPDTCASDNECQQQCTPPLQNGVYCCDQQTATCYAWSGNTFCPVPIIDAGFD